MKRYFSVIAIAFLMLFCGATQALTWNQMTQTQHISSMMIEANREVGTYGGQCIVWVKNLASVVSGGQVVVPSYYPTKVWQLDMSQAQGLIQKPVYPTMYLEYGDIVQMLFHNSNGTTIQHTAVIAGRGYGKDDYGYTGNGYYLTDSNMVPPGQGIVALHFWTDQTFMIRMGNQYTVYKLK